MEKHKPAHFMYRICNFSLQNLLFWTFLISAITTLSLSAKIALKKDYKVSLVGAGMGSRMVHYGHFETEVQLRFPHYRLVIRNLCDEGNTPGFRPHPGRGQEEQFAFPGAKELVPARFRANTQPAGFFETPDQWLTRLQTDVVLAFFGFNSSFSGEAGLDSFKKELNGYIKHTLRQRYNGESQPLMALISPTAVEPTPGVTDGTLQNKNLAIYTDAMREIARKNRITFVDCYQPSLDWYNGGQRHTLDGALLNDLGNRKLANLLCDQIFGRGNPKPEKREAIHDAVMDKNFYWLNDFKVPNGVHVYGRRYNPYGPKNYPFELQKTRQYTDIRDRAIWAAGIGAGTRLFFEDEAPGNSRLSRGWEFVGAPSPVLSGSKSLMRSGRGNTQVVVDQLRYPHEVTDSTDEFFFWVYLDPRDTPKQIMVQFHNGNWEHRAYWGENLIPYGIDNTTGRKRLGNLPSTGTWHRLSVRAHQIGLAVDSKIQGMAITQWGGTTYWDRSGVHFGRINLEEEDRKTLRLPRVETNYRSDNIKHGKLQYIPGEQAVKQLKPALGYKVELFADEKRFPDLANPVQMSFDNQGRLWVATMASYPHYRIGDPKPQDKLIIFEDTDNDGKADKQTNFADDLHIPIGFEISHDGVYVSQGANLVLLKDTDGDDRYDEKEVVLSGFDDHDTHHAISAFCADPSGALLMGEGIFLHSNVETVFGPIRGTNGGFFRYSPQNKSLVRHAQLKIPNPWGICVDAYGQEFFLHTSGPALGWMLPGEVNARYGAALNSTDLLSSNKVRPTSGLEIVSSRHFPDEVQGDILINNNIGFLGIKQHQLIDSDPGFETKYRQDLLFSTDTNFRPVDLEFAPDGSLYVVDWQNALIGHMQHNARDPNRDHAHGRIYRITYPSRPLVQPAKIANASIPELLENLKLPELRTRYRTRRELRGRNPNQVAAAAIKWADSQEDDRLKLEALWVTWGADRIHKKLLLQLLESKDHRVRSAAVQVLRNNLSNFEDENKLLLTAAGDTHGRVRLSALTTATYLPQTDGLEVIDKAKEKGVGATYQSSLDFAESYLLKNQQAYEEDKHKIVVPEHLSLSEGRLFLKGAEIYEKEGYCGTCHQENGMGLPDAGFPPLADTKWVNGDQDRLIKLTLKGLMGPIEVKGREYPGLVPMTPFESLLDDYDAAAVLTFIRNSFGNKSDPILPWQVNKVRGEIKGKQGFYSPAELLTEHPYPN